MMHSFRVEFKSGSVYWPENERIRFKKLAEQGDRLVHLLVDMERSTRSTNQNALYWKRNQVLAEHMGESKDVLHELLMHRCGYGKHVEIAGQSLWIRDTSTKLSVEQFTALMKEQDEIGRFLSDDFELPGE